MGAHIPRTLSGAGVRTVYSRCFGRSFVGTPLFQGTAPKRTITKGMAGTTRLELATSAVTGQRSNQLNYVPAARWVALRASAKDAVSGRLAFQVRNRMRIGGQC